MMKKAILFKLLAVLVLGSIFAFGPRPGSNQMITFSKPEIGDDVQAFLETKESSVADLKTGAGKEIIWADPISKSKTDIAVVYIHGFSATKHEIRPVPDQIAKSLKANLFYTRLAGHGQSAESFANATVQQWADDYAEAIAVGRRLGERILVISTSTGSTLATLASSDIQMSKDIIGLVMLSPNFATQSLPSWVANMPWAESLLPLIGGEERSWEPINEEQAKWWTTTYPMKAIFPMFELLQRVEAIDKSTIKVPAYFIYSPYDQVIVPAAIENVANQWGGSVKHMRVTSDTDPSHHVITGDIVSPANTKMVVDAILDWVKER